MLETSANIAFTPAVPIEIPRYHSPFTPPDRSFSTGCLSLLAQPHSSPLPRLPDRLSDRLLSSVDVSPHVYPHLQNHPCDNAPPEAPAFSASSPILPSPINISYLLSDASLSRSPSRSPASQSNVSKKHAGIFPLGQPSCPRAE